MYGYIKIGAAVPNVKVAHCAYNAAQILECIEKAAIENIKLLVFPELSVCGYTCGDLFFQSKLISECEKTVGMIVEKSKALDVVSVIGVPVLVNSALYNCAAVIHAEKILGFVPKRVLTNGGEFYEKRWFKSGGICQEESVSYCGESVPFGNIIFRCGNYEHFSFAVEICADLWSPFAPSGVYAGLGATVIANPSASPNYAGKPKLRERLIVSQSEKCGIIYIYCGSSIGESSADAVYDGQAVIAEQGRVIAESERYSVENVMCCAEADLENAVFTRAKSPRNDNCAPPLDVTYVSFDFINEDNVKPSVTPSSSPFIPDGAAAGEFYAEIFNIQTFGLYKRLAQTGIKKTVLGVSGGLDSTLALLAAANCHDKLGLPRQNILGVTMPGFGTSGRTHSNAISLMKELGTASREISIKDACLQHFKDIGLNIEEKNAAFENAQARERTQILMDIANMENGIVLGTGDMSELALGWATYNGDHMSMYNVNAGIPKTVIRGLIGWIMQAGVFNGEICALLEDVLETPVSPELLPTDEGGGISQKTEDLIGPYELHDFFIYCCAYKGFSPEKTEFLATRAFSGVYDGGTVRKWLNAFYKRFFSQQFKRSCAPDGPKALEFGISQRTDLKIPSDAEGSLWL